MGTFGHYVLLLLGRAAYEFNKYISSQPICLQCQLFLLPFIAFCAQSKLRKRHLCVLKADLGIDSLKVSQSLLAYSLEDFQGHPRERITLRKAFITLNIRQTLNILWINTNGIDGVNTSKSNWVDLRL